MQKLLLFLCGVGVLACSEDPEGGPSSYTVSDSAGVAIVTNTAPHWSPGEAWAISPRPTLVIGELEGPPEFTFGNARAAGRLPDGTYYVGDEQARTVRVFSPEGDYLGAIGREGDGPGELRTFLTVAPYRGDSLWIYDYSQRRVNVFGPDHAFARSFPNPLPALSNYWVVATLADGRFLMVTPGTTPIGASPGTYSDSSQIVVLAPNGTTADTVGSFHVRTLQIGPNGRPERSHFQASPAVTGTGNRIVVVDPTSFEVHEFDLVGRLKRVSRIPFVPEPVTNELLESYWAWSAARLGANPEIPVAELERRVRDGHYPEYLPATSFEVLVDAGENTWVARYHFPGQVATSWEVFDPEGIWLGSLETPPDFDVKQILSDEIIGIWTDEYDVAYLHSYSLDRP